MIKLKNSRKCTFKMIVIAEINFMNITGKKVRQCLGHCLTGISFSLK